jgi:hypothetical protein
MALFDARLAQERDARVVPVARVHAGRSLGPPRVAEAHLDVVQERVALAAPTIANRA